MSKRAEEDLKYWHAWKSSGQQPTKLEPLLSRFDGMVSYTVNKYKGQGGVAGNIPEPVLRAEVQNNLMDAFESYDPSKNVQLSTYAQHHLKKTYRFVTTHQNVARIPEPYTNRITEYSLASERLQNKLNRPPSSIELADVLKWPVSHVETMQRSLRKDLSPHSFQVDPVSLRTSRFEEVKSLIPYELTPQENAVFELLMSTNTPISKIDIARRLNISPSRVSKINKKIAQKMLAYGV